LANGEHMNFYSNKHTNSEEAGPAKKCRNRFTAKRWRRISLWLVGKSEFCVFKKKIAVVLITNLELKKKKKTRKI
jgi:hypothetical protein